MIRRISPALVVLFVFMLTSLSACKSPERAAIQPLPEEGTPISFEDLSFRIKDQVLASQEFFFRDSWEDVQQAARALRDSAVRLKTVNPDQVPDKLRTTLVKHSEELTKAADDLHAAGAAKDVNRTNDVFQRLNLKVRDLRVE